MGELVKALQKYIARDLVYLVVGGSVILTFFYVFDRLPASSDRWPTVSYLLVAGVGYIVAYTVQDICSVIRVVTTAPIHEAWPPLRWLYERFEHEEWRQIPANFDFRDAETKVIGDPAVEAEYERHIMLMQIGTTGGPCAVLCALLLGYKVFRAGVHADRPVLIGVMVLGVLLIVLGLLKVAQLAQFLHRLCSGSARSSADGARR